MNFDVIGLILPVLAVWIGMGLVGGGLTFASLQKTFPREAADNYSRDEKRFWIFVLAGPFSLPFWVLGLSVCLRYHGILFPGSSGWSRSDARAFQRRAWRSGDTTID